MTLLQQIQKDAIDGSTDIATVLRKCRVLAQRLKNEEFKQWINYELNGYPSQDALPNYRVIRCQSSGHFSGRFGKQLRNAPISMTCIPQEIREHLIKVFFTEGVSALQDLVRDNENGTLQEMWPPELYVMVGQQIYQDMNLAQAWKIIPKNAVVGILDTV